MGRTKTVTTHLYSENPNGLHYHEISNKTCKLFVVHRSLIDEINEIKELEKPALYILLGDNSAEYQEAYIGETKNFIHRVKDHKQKKDFWEKALIIVAKDESFHPTVVEYLEHLAINKAKNLCSSRYTLHHNNQIPQAPYIETSNKGLYDGYFSDIQFLVKFAGCNIFEPANSNNDKKHETFCLQGKNYDAKGFYNENGFTVYKQSKIARGNKKSLDWKSERNRLVKKITEEENGSYILKENIKLNSPSKAASFVTGSKINGRIAWIDKDGNTLGSKY